MSMSSAFTVSLADVLIIGVLFLFAFYGSKRGVRRTLNSIFRIYFSFIIAILFYEKLALLFQATVVSISSGAARVICFTILFAIFLWLKEMQATGKIPLSVEILEEIKPKNRAKDTRIAGQITPVANGYWHKLPTNSMIEGQNNLLFQILDLRFQIYELCLLFLASDF